MRRVIESCRIPGDTYWPSDCTWYRKEAAMPEKPKAKAGHRRGTPPIDDETLRQRIEERAYFKYCERGCMPGEEWDDWLVAEQEVLAEVTRDATGVAEAATEAPDARRSGRGRRRR